MTVAQDRPGLREVPMAESWPPKDRKPPPEPTLNHVTVTIRKHSEVGIDQLHFDATDTTITRSGDLVITNRITGERHGLAGGSERVWLTFDVERKGNT